MKNNLRKTSALLAALMLAVSCASCGKKSSSSDSGTQKTSSKNMVEGPGSNVDISDSDMPYGAKMTEYGTEEGCAIKTYVDSRYVSVEEAVQLSKFIAAVGKNDVAMFEEAVYPASLKAMLNKLKFDTTKDYLSYLHDSLLQYTEGEYEFDYVNSEKYVGEGVYDYSPITDPILAAEPDAEITNKKQLEVDALFDHSNKSIHYRMGSYIIVNILTINGKPYVALDAS